MSKSLLLCSLLLLAYAAGSEENPPALDATVERLRHAMADTSPTSLTNSKQKDPTALPEPTQPKKKAEKKKRVDQRRSKTARDAYKAATTKLAKVMKAKKETKAAKKKVAAPTPKTTKGGQGKADQKKKASHITETIDFIAAKKKAAVKKAAAITQKARDAAKKILQKAKAKAKMMETTAAKDAQDIKFRAIATDTMDAIETQKPFVSRAQEKAFSTAKSLLKKRGRELSNLELVRMVMKKAKGGGKAAYRDEDRELGLDHEGAGEAGHKRIHKKAFKEACKKVNNNLMGYVLKSANKGIRATFHAVKSSQKVLNSLPDGRHCRFKNQRLVKHARELIKKRIKELKVARNSLHRALATRVEFTSTFETAACPSFFTSPNFLVAKREVNRKRRLLSVANGMLTAARDNLKAQLKEAAAARHRCHCAVKRNAIKSHHVATKKTPTRMKAILRELMVRCLVYGNSRAKCKKIRLSRGYQRRLRLQRTKLVYAAEKEKCAGIDKKKKPMKAGKYTGAAWCETFHSCLKGDGRNFWAWVKAKGYERFKGACAQSNGRYGNRHKYWHGKFTFNQCKAKCNAMGKRCQGITMPTTIRRVK